MTLLGPFDRHVALHTGGAPPRRPARRAIVPPPPPPVPDRAQPRYRTQPSDRTLGRDRTQLEIARFLARSLLSDASWVAGVLAELEAYVDELVVTWSPSIHATSRTELVTALLESDDAVTDVTVTIVREGVAGPIAYLEWRAAGRFDNAAFLNDDVLVEPSHGTVEAAGVSVVTFSGGRAARIDCFYDVLAILEQMLAPS